MQRLDVPEDRGLLHGLLSGTLVGSLVYGEPFSGIGAADILLVLLGVSVVLRLKRSGSATQQQGRTDGRQRNGTPRPPVDMQSHPATRNARQHAASHDEDDARQPQRPPRVLDIPEDEANPQLYERAASMWDYLSSDTDTPAPARKLSEGIAAPTPADGRTARDAYRADAEIPEDFDSEDFLKGAKLVFSRLQHSWDTRDMNDIAQFTTPEVLDEISRQAAQTPATSVSEILLVNARLLEVRDEDNGLLATVFFDVLMRESTGGAKTEQVREIWHFLKGDVTGGMWRLDGIEHLAA